MSVCPILRSSWPCLFNLCVWVCVWEREKREREREIEWERENERLSCSCKNAEKEEEGTLSKTGNWKSAPTKFTYINTYILSTAKEILVHVAENRLKSRRVQRDDLRGAFLQQKNVPLIPTTYRTTWKLTFIFKYYLSNFIPNFNKIIFNIS